MSASSSKCSDFAIGQLIVPAERRIFTPTEDPVGLAHAKGRFRAWCVDPKGRVEWESIAENTLTTQGANSLAGLWFNAGTAIGSNAVYMGLFASGTAPTTASTMAVPIATEQTGGGYARKNVLTASWTTASGGSVNNTANPASWTASGTSMTNVTYLFICNSASGTTGVMFSFATITGGPYTVTVGSTLNVTYQWTVA